MKKVRLIARLDIKNDYLVKGIHLEGLRKLGMASDFAKSYYDQGIDEIIYMDIVASLYNRNNLSDLVKKTTEDVFIPITVGGGIRSIDDVQELLRAGADKVAINTAAIKRPQLISEISTQFGSQCMVLSIEAKKISEGKWEAYYDNGRERTGIDVVEWAKQGFELGAGEILITSVDQEGTEAGFDYELVKAITEVVTIPVIVSGGMGKIEDVQKVVLDSKADAVAIASILHYKKSDIHTLKSEALLANVNMRRNL